MSKTMKMLFRFLLLVGLVVPALASGGRITVLAAERYEDMINCDLNTGSCYNILATGCRVTLAVEPKPVRAMTDLLFRVTLSGNLPATVSPPYIDLGMPAMHMGPSRVVLSSTDQRSYEGRGIIVRCPSGNKIWRATVIIPGIGQTEFIFHVIY